MLAPGAGAHAGWWSEIAGRLASEFRVVALDFSGSGDSDHRPSYEASTWIAELVAVVEREASGSAAIVGHSNGGRLALMAGCRHPELVSGVMMVDSPTRRPPLSGSDPRHRFDPGPPRVYASLQKAVAGFRLRPHEPVLNRDFLLRVAEESFRPVEGGWSLKADHRSYGVVKEREFAECLEATRAPALLVYGNKSVVVAPQDVDYFLDCLPGRNAAIPIPDGRHHLLFDHVEELERLIREFLAGDAATSAG